MNFVIHDPSASVKVIRRAHGVQTESQRNRPERSELALGLEASVIPSATKRSEKSQVGGRSCSNVQRRFTHLAILLRALASRVPPCPRRPPRCGTRTADALHLNDTGEVDAQLGSVVGAIGGPRMDVGVVVDSIHRLEVQGQDSGGDGEIEAAEKLDGGDT